MILPNKTGGGGGSVVGVVVRTVVGSGVEVTLSVVLTPSVNQSDHVSHFISLVGEMDFLQHWFW